MAVVSELFENLGADGAVARLGLMGGTFDPIHNAHLSIAQGVCERLSLDAVLFIPTGNPVFKRDIQVTPAEVRLEMVRRAVASNPRFDVSAIEVERGGDTYTVDTLRALREHYPGNVEFFFITGSDAAADLWKWKDSATIAELATIVVTQRPGAEMTALQKERILADAPFRLEFVDVPLLDIASSKLRLLAAEGHSIRYYVPAEAYEVIAEAGLYGMRDAGMRPSSEPARFFENGDAGTRAQDADALSDEFIEARREQLALRVKPKRLRHILGVADMAACIAEAYGLDARKAYLGGLLHDWDKGLDDEGIRKRVRMFAIPVNADVLRRMPQVLHGPTAAAVLGCSYPQIPADVLQAIDRHTTGAVGMADLDMVVYVADAIELNRDYPGVKGLRKLIGGVSLESLFLETFVHTLKNLVDRGIPVHPDTISIWNSYASHSEACIGKKGK